MRRMFFLWVACAGGVFAQSGREQQRIGQQQARDWKKQQEDLRLEGVRSRPAEDSALRPSLAKEDVVPKDAPKIWIREVRVTGADLLPAEERARLLRGFERRDLSSQDLENVTRRLTNWYINHGYVASRVYLPQQDLGAGILEVRVVEGTVEKVELTKDERIGLGTAFPGVTGRVLNLRDLEQGLDQINRLQGRRATLALDPGEQLGGTVVKVTPERTKLLPTTISVDNGGLNSTGKWAVRAQTFVEELFGVNDQFVFSYARDPSGRDDEHFNESASVLFSVPYGYWTFQGGGNYSDYENELGSRYLTDGRTVGVYGGVTRMLYRDQHLKWQTGLQVSWQDSEHFIEGARLQTSSRKLSTVLWTTDLAYVGTDVQANVSTGIQQGVDWFGSCSNEDRSSASEAYAEGQAYTFDLGGQWMPRIPGVKQALIWSSNVHMQYAPQRLYSSQQISLGGDSSVRGFRDETVLADSGAYWRNEWICSGLPLGWAGLYVFRSASPYAFVDMGSIFGPGNESEAHGLMSSAGMGLRLGGEHLSVNTYVAFPLSAPEQVKESDFLYYLSVQYSL